MSKDALEDMREHLKDNPVADEHYLGFGQRTLSPREFVAEVEQGTELGMTFRRHYQELLDRQSKENEISQLR